jgi:hypothetical protein
MVMVLGIVSLFVAPIILGPMAWIMGRNDLKDMDAGRMDRSGRDNTNVGTVCGMISTILGGVALSVILLFVVLCMGLPVMMGLMSGAAPTSRAPVTAPVAKELAGPEMPAPTLAFNGNVEAGQRITSCPHCQQLLQYSDDYDSQSHFRCAKCNRVFKGD